MDNRPRVQSVDGGLVGCQLWTSPLEGAFTRTAKIALVNALDPRALCELLFGRKLLQTSFADVHGRSFLNSIWAAPKAQGATGRSVLPGFLTGLCGGLATAIAGDARLRLCCSCADAGYQSSLFQIDALSTCPIHGEPLIDACPHCNAPTPRYALSLEAFLSPMQCTACGVGYGRAWNGTADFESWTGPGDVRPLQRLKRCLQSWQSFQLEWPDASNWVDDPSAEPAVSRRVHVFHALMTLTGTVPDARSRVMARTCPCVPTTSLRRPPSDKPRVAIYKSIWRQIVKRFQLGWLMKGFQFNETFYLHRVNEAIVPKHARCAPGLHAFVLWTKRCEDGESHLMARWLGRRRSTELVRVLKLRTSLLLWPTDVQVPDSAWGHFIWSCFLEDLWTARQWHALAEPLGDPLEQDDKTSALVQADRAAFLERLASWTPKMSPLLELFPSGISQFTWQQGRAQRHLSLVTIHRFEGAWHAEP